MTVGIPSIKMEAKAALKGKWVSSIIAVLSLLFSLLMIYNIGWVLSLVIGDIAGIVVFFALFVLLCGPLILGVVRFFWRMYGGIDETPAVAFYYFASKKAFSKAFQLCVMLTVRFLLISLIFHLPAILLSAISNPESYELLKMPIPMWSQHLKPLSDFLSSIGKVLTVFSTMKFYLAPILVIADDKMVPEEALLMSKVIFKSSIMDFVFLLLSLIVWLILSILYIPLIFTLPYFIMCYIVHSLYAIKDYNEKIEKLNGDNLPSFVAGI